MSSNEPVKNGCEVIYETFHIPSTWFQIRSSIYETFHVSLNINTLRLRETTWSESKLLVQEQKMPSSPLLEKRVSNNVDIFKNHPKRTELTSISCHITVHFEWESCAFWVDPVLPVVLCIGRFPDVFARDSRERRRFAFFN